MADCCSYFRTFNCHTFKSEQDGLEDCFKEDDQDAGYYLNEESEFDEYDNVEKDGKEGAKRRHRHCLDIATGAQVYMKKQRIHIVAVINMPVYLLWTCLLLIIRSPLYAGCVVKPTLRMPVLLFRRKWVLSQMKSYLYIRCSATSLKAYGKIWLAPGSWLAGSWLASSYMTDGWASVPLIFYVFLALALSFIYYTVVNSIEQLWQGVCLKFPGEKTRQKVASRPKLYHPVDLTDSSEFPLLQNYRFRWRIYKAIPGRVMSRLWGKFNKLTLPVWFRPYGYRLYIWLFDCKMHEAEVTELGEFRNLRDFFTRRLKPSVRPIHRKDTLVSPADGTVLYCGKVQNDTLEQIKGVTYTMRSFFGPLTEPVFATSDVINKCKHHLIHNSVSDCSLETMKHSQPKCLPKSYSIPYTNAVSYKGVHQPDPTKNNFNLVVVLQYGESLKKHANHELFYCIIYLAPGDYHRFHSPADWKVKARRHFSGELFSVKPSIARWLQGLFCINERALYTGIWQYGFFAMTAVGATNVGSVHVNFDPELETSHVDSGDLGYYEDKSFKTKSNGVSVNKGEYIGHFNLGSTIVLIFEAPSHFQLKLKPGQKLKYGQGIGACVKRRK